MQRMGDRAICSLRGHSPKYVIIPVRIPFVVFIPFCFFEKIFVCAMNTHRSSKASIKSFKSSMNTGRNSRSSKTAEELLIESWCAADDDEDDIDIMPITNKTLSRGVSSLITSHGNTHSGMMTSNQALMATR